VIVADVEPPDPTPNEKSVAVPDIEKDCGLPAALSENASAAERVPVAVGVNVTFTMQVAPAPSVPPGAGQVPPDAIAKSPLFAPVMDIPVTVRVALPGFPSITDCDMLVVPTIWAEKFVGLPGSETAGPIPVPDSATVCGLPGALSVIVSVAERVPGAVGVKTRFTAHAVAVATLPPPDGHVLPLATAKSPLADPVIEMFEITRELVPVSARPRDCAVEAAPTL
jgi:hypothetical protein